MASGNAAEDTEAAKTPLPPLKPMDPLVKLAKLNPPKFFGQPWDWNHFKKDFKTILKVEGRLDVKIGTHLRSGIPERFKHLIQHVDS